MDGDLSPQKLQLTLPDQFEDCEEFDLDGKAMEVWPTVERLTEYEYEYEYELMIWVPWMRCCRSPAVRLRCVGWCRVQMRNGEKTCL